MNRTSLMRLVNVIESQGPISAEELWIETGIRDQKAQLLKDLREYQLSSGRIRYDIKSKKWERASRIAGIRTKAEFKPLVSDLYANARLRAGAMDYKSLPSRF